MEGEGGKESERQREGQRRGGKRKTGGAIGREIESK